jgi:hypothetical protein
VPAVIAVRGSGSFHLDRHDLMRAELNQESQFPSFVSLALVVQPGPWLTQGKLGARLGGDEPIQEAAKQIPAA